MAITFEWDEQKNLDNFTKHGIDFETAKEIFEDPLVYRFIERIEDGEERWHAYGIVNGFTILMAVYTTTDDVNNEVIRIISARKASASERRLYANG
jgi:uncharacterized DUF497 family protein